MDQKSERIALRQCTEDDFPNREHYQQELKAVDDEFESLVCPEMNELNLNGTWFTD